MSTQESPVPTNRGRKVRCRTCGPCLAKECRVCANCLDKQKFGGQNRRKQACIQRKCVRLTTTIQPTVTPKMTPKNPIVAARKMMRRRRRSAPLPSLSTDQPAKEVTKPKSPFTPTKPKQKKALTPGAILPNLSRRASQDTPDPEAAPSRSPAPAQLTASSHASVAWSPLRPWVKYAPSPSHASPSAGILKRKKTVDDLDSSNDGSPVLAKRLRLDMGGDVPAPRRVHFNDNPVSEIVEIPRRKRKAKIPKFKVTVIGLCRFYNMVDYPLLVTNKMREQFQDFSSFESFYVPLLTSVNPMSHLLEIKMFCRAKWREGFTAEAGVV